MVQHRCLSILWLLSSMFFNLNLVCHLHLLLHASKVESYNPTDNKWILRPSLSGQPRGSLAGARLENKIFAIGGENGSEFFSGVEMLDLDLGRWIMTQSMLEKVLHYSLG